MCSLEALLAIASVYAVCLDVHEPASEVYTLSSSSWIAETASEVYTLSSSSWIAETASEV